MKKMLLLAVLGLFLIFMFTTNVKADTTSYTSSINSEENKAHKDKNYSTSTEKTSDIIENNFKLEDNEYTFTISYGDLNGKIVRGACSDRLCDKIYYLGQTKNSKQYYVAYDTNRYLYVDIFQDHKHGDTITANFDIFTYDENSEVLIPSETEGERADMDYLSQYIHYNATLPTNTFKYINMDKVEQLNKQVTFKRTPKPMTKDIKTIDQSGPISISSYEEFLTTQNI